MQIQAKPTILLLASLFTGGGAWAGYEIYKPRTVKDLADWKGLKLVGDNDTNLWRALYFQNKLELPSTVSNHEELKKSCLNIWKKSLDYGNKNFGYAEKFCIDDLKSRKARIIATGFKEEDFLQKDEDYKTAFTINRYSASFLSFLNREGLTKDSEIGDESEGEEILKAYKDYCEVSLNANETKIAITKQFCGKYHYKTAKDIAEKEGYGFKDNKDFESEWKQYEWTAEDDKRNYTVGNTLLEDIQGEDKDHHWTELRKKKDKFVKQFKNWCDTNKGKDLFENKFYKETYPKFKTRCLKNSVA